NQPGRYSVILYDSPEETPACSRFGVVYDIYTVSRRKLRPNPQNQIFVTYVMRVAIITAHAESADKVDGGVQAVTRYLVDALTRLEGIDLHVVNFKYGLGEPRSLEEAGYRRHILPGGRLGTLTGFQT